MVKRNKCLCGNVDINKFYEYEGCLGYEAVICKVCGRYSDYYGEYEATEFSKQFIQK